MESGQAWIVGADVRRFYGICRSQLRQSNSRKSTPLWVGSPQQAVDGNVGTLLQI
jgi:hypothetical protein